MSTRIEEALAFAKRFKYKSDTKGVVDKWSVIEEELTGDCEDFSLTVLWILSGRSWTKLFRMVLFHQAMIWHAKLRKGEGHAMLWVKNLGWIDNNTRSFNPSPPAKKVLPYLLPLLMTKILLSKFRK